MLTGYRTYISAGVIALATFAHAMGWINDSIFQTIAAAAGATGLAALRAAVK